MASHAAAAPADQKPVDEADLTSIPLEDLLDLDVYAASRFEQKISEAPSAVRVITAAEIRDFGWRTLAEALASLPGLYTSYDRSYAYLGARGFLRPGDYDTRFLLLVDGNRVNDPVYDQAPMGTDFVVDMDLVDRIEYVPGPGSSGYGSNAFFGVVNVVTRAGRDYPAVEGRVELGSDGYTVAAARYGWQGANGEVLLAASGMTIDGADLYFPEFDTPETNDGIAEGLDDDRARRFLANGSYGAFHVSMQHAERTKGDPAAAFRQIFNDPRSFNRDERTLFNLGYGTRVSENVEMTARVFLGRYAYDGRFVYFPEPGPQNIDGSRAVWAGVGVQAISTAWSRHKLVFGFEGQYDLKRDLFNYDDPPFVSYLDVQSTNRRFGTYVEDEFRIRDTVLMNAGLRLDYDGVSGTHLSPRLALIYSPSERTNVKAILGSAYRSPNLYETTYTDANAGSDYALDAETIRTQELVWSQRFGTRTNLTVSLFRYSLDNLIDESVNPGSGAIFFTNEGSVETSGGEVSLDHVWDSGTMLRASYGHARAEDDAGDLENSPRRIGKLNLSTPVPGTRLRAGIEGRYISSRLGDLASVDSYRLANMTLTWQSRESDLEVSATVRNLFDERYSDPAGPAYVQNAIEQDGRTWLLRAIYRF